MAKARSLPIPNLPPKHQSFPKPSLPTKHDDAKHPKPYQVGPPVGVPDPGKMQPGNGGGK